MKVYITKYALTQGILYADVEREEALADGTVRTGVFFYLPNDKYKTYVGRSHWHLTLEKAEEKAQKMKDKATAKLQAQLKAMEESMIPLVMLTDYGTPQED